MKNKEYSLTDIGFYPNGTMIFTLIKPTKAGRKELIRLGIFIVNQFHQK